jgi:peroxiredoxin
MKKMIASVLVLLVLVCVNVYPQNSEVKTGIVGQKISNFTLPTYQGQEFSMQSLRGKNVLFIVSRGKYADTKWCTICHYQYADWANLALTKNIREKYNLEIVFMLPYPKDSLINWEKAFPAEMAKVEKWKNPDHPESLTAKQKEWMEFARTTFPQTFDFMSKKVPLPLPVLIDDKLEVSKGLDLSRTEWDKCKTLQNIPAVFIIDKEGVIRFKYISQNTVDRPTSDYILNFIEKML